MCAPAAYARNPVVAVNRTLTEPRTRLGLIIPSSNRMTEPQLRHYAPADVEVHVTRLRMTGAHQQPVEVLRGHIVESTLALADARCDAIVFHCTAAAMQQGLDGNAFLAGVMRAALINLPHVRVATTGSAVLAALAALGARRLLVMSASVQASHDHQVAFLTEAGLEVVGSYCLALSGSDRHVAVTAEDWRAWARSRAQDTPSAEAVFLSGANTRAAEAVPGLEQLVQRPVITSTSAVLWYALRLCGRTDRVEDLGRVFDVAPTAQLDGAAGASPT